MASVAADAKNPDTVKLNKFKDMLIGGNDLLCSGACNTQPIVYNTDTLKTQSDVDYKVGSSAVSVYEECFPETGVPDNKIPSCRLCFYNLPKDEKARKKMFNQSKDKKAKRKPGTKSKESHGKTFESITGFISARAA